MEEYTLTRESEEATRIKGECEMQLKRVMPALNEAVNSIKPIPKHDITEIKAMKKPPKVIKLIMRALCILLEVQPVMKKAKDGGKYKPSYTVAAQGKDLLGDPGLPQKLVEFDRSKITLEMMNKLEKEVMNHADYSFDNAYRASKSAPPFFDWVRAVRDYFYIFKEIEPRRDAYMFSEI